MKNKTSTTAGSSGSALAAAWARLAAREQRAVSAAVVVVVLAGLWWWVGAPAWTTWQHAPQQHRVLDAQWQQVQTLAVQARALQAQPLLSRDDRLRALETATQRLLGNSAKLQISGDQATVTLQRAPAAGMASWLAEVRTNARLTPTESRLTRDGNNATPTNPPTTAGRSGPTWSGTVLLSL
jgi:general secretion pathway protein M